MSAVEDTVDHPENAKRHAPVWLQIVSGGAVAALIAVLTTFWSAAHSSGVIETNVSNLQTEIAQLTEHQRTVNEQLEIARGEVAKAGQEVAALRQGFVDMVESSRELRDEMVKLRIELAREHK